MIKMNNGIVKRTKISNIVTRLLIIDKKKIRDIVYDYNANLLIIEYNTRNKRAFFITDNMPDTKQVIYISRVIDL